MSIYITRVQINKWHETVVYIHIDILRHWKPKSKKAFWLIFSLCWKKFYALNKVHYKQLYKKCENRMTNWKYYLLRRVCYFSTSNTFVLSSREHHGHFTKRYSLQNNIQWIRNQHYISNSWVYHDSHPLPLKDNIFINIGMNHFLSATTKVYLIKVWDSSTRMFFRFNICQFSPNIICYSQEVH